MSEAVRSHLVIPDTQCRPGVPVAHLDWIGQYIVDRRPDVVIHLGDLFDMASLSKHNLKGSKKLEGMRIVADVDAGKDGARRLIEPAQKAGVADQIDWERLLGNHEMRVDTLVEEDPKFEGFISLDDLDTPGWKVRDYLEPVWIDGVCYSHYFYQPLTGKPFAGTCDNRLKHIGHSFTMGHQQTMLYSIRYVAGKSQHGLVAGACYLHDEDYKGPQGNAHWRGVIVKHEVSDGSYSPMFVTLDYLCRRYEGMSLARFKKLNKIRSCA